MPADSMRERFVAVSSSLLDEMPRLAIVLADIGAANFRDSGAMERYPLRVLNVGIREQLLVGFAAGMAMEDFRPIVHTYAPFLVERPFEQLKLDFGHQGLGGVFVSVGASYDAAASGRTHHAPEDVALVATLPGWKIHVPGHPDEAEALIRSAAAGTGCEYIRLAEDSSASAMASSDHFTLVRQGSTGAPAVIAIGPMLERVLNATADLDVTVLYGTTVRPFDAVGLRAAAASEVVLVEPYLAGTSAAEISAALNDRPHRLLALGVQRTESRRYGARQEHDAAHGLDARGIRAAIAGFVDGRATG